ncbi:hypothetical protein BH20ACT8_BH20ACT8_02110 [soil metagenome]
MNRRNRLVGITCYVEQARFGSWNLPSAVLPAAYVNVVEEAGGRPVLLPPTASPEERTLDALDAVVFAGGADIAPQLYQRPNNDAIAELRPDRDHTESLLLRGALERNLPVLGICRGMQLLNVARGGALVADLGERRGVHHTTGGTFTRHAVAVDPGSRLASIVGTQLEVSSHHHQAPDIVGRGLTAVAWSPDGVVEAVEDPDARFAVGVLWHPEADEDPTLFRAMLEAAA